MKQLAIALVVCGLTLTGVASAAPCTAADASCTQWLKLGTGSSRGLVYATHPLSARNENIVRALVVVHGASRDADNYFRSTLAAAFLAGALENTLLVVPRIASNNGQGCKDELATDEVSWNCSSWRSGGPALNNPNLTSFDFLDQILRTVADKSVFPNMKAIVVAGHSAGAQVVNRYQMGNQVHETLGTPVSYVVANPSSYAYPDSMRPTEAAYPVSAHAPGYVVESTPNAEPFRRFGDATDCTTYDQWPYGFKNRFGYTAKQTDDQLRKQLASRPTTYLVGELDVLPLGGFDASCPAMAQGPTRLARGEAFAKYVKQAATIVPECGHNARCMFTAEVALPLLFPK